MQAKISIVTVSYNSSEVTIDYLKSLREQTNMLCDVILVDNASSKPEIDELLNWLRNNHIRGLQVLKNAENLGFSGGCNVGISRALKNGSNWVILLNNDTKPRSGLFAELGAILEGREGIVSIPMDEGRNTAFCGKMRWLSPFLEHCYDSPDEMKGMYAIGGGVAIHSSVFEKIGYFDEKYFLYFEDADFSVRAVKAGIPFSVAKEIKIRHLVQASTKKIGSPLLLRYHYRNALYFNNKLGPLYVRFLIWPWSLAIVIWQLLKILVRKDVRFARAINDGVIDFYRNRMGKINVL